MMRARKISRRYIYSEKRSYGATIDINLAVCKKLNTYVVQEKNKFMRSTCLVSLSGRSLLALRTDKDIIHPQRDEGANRTQSQNRTEYEHTQLSMHS
jgi:hypothetical protein